MIFAKILKTTTLCVISAFIGTLGSATAQDMTEQQKRDLFLRVRDEQKTQQKVTPPVKRTIPKPAAQPKKTAPQTPKPSQQQRTPRQAPPTDPNQPRFGHGSTTRPSSAAPRQIPTQNRSTRPPIPTPAPEVEEGPGFRGTVRNIFNNARDRLQSLPRTSQSQGDELPQQPAVITQTAPPVSATSAKNGPSLKNIPRAQSEPEIPPAPKKSTTPLRHAFADSQEKAANHNIDFNDPAVNQAIEKATEVAEKLASKNADKIGQLKESAIAKTPPAPPKPEASKAPGKAAQPQQIAMNMAGSAFERFARQSIALALTTVLVSSADASLLAASQKDAAPVNAADDKPEYVKAIERLGQTVPTKPANKKEPAPPTLNDFIISSEYQTDLDLESSDMTFVGKVIVESSRIHLTCDKFIVHMRKDRKGMSYGEALGNVVINMLDKGVATGNIGYSKTAIYRPDQEEITLSGWPRIEQEGKELVAVNSETRFILHTSGRIKTEGRARTVLRN